MFRLDNSPFISFLLVLLSSYLPWLDMDLLQFFYHALIWITLSFGSFTFIFSMTWYGLLLILFYLFSHYFIWIAIVFLFLPWLDMVMYCFLSWLDMDCYCFIYPFMTWYELLIYFISSMTWYGLLLLLFYCSMTWYRLFIYYCAIYCSMTWYGIVYLLSFIFSYMTWYGIVMIIVPWCDMDCLLLISLFLVWITCSP